MSADGPKIPENTPSNLLWAFLGFLAVCLLVLVSPFIGLWKLVTLYNQSPATQQRRAYQAALTLYEQAKGIQERTKFPYPHHEYGDSIVLTFIRHAKEKHLPSYPIYNAFRIAAQQLYDKEGFGRELKPPETNMSLIELARYTDTTTEFIDKLAIQGTLPAFEGMIVAAFLNFTKRLPPQALHTPSQLLEFMEGKEKPTFTIPLIDIVEPGPLVEELVLPLFSELAEKHHLFKSVKEQLERNQHNVSDIPFTPENRHHAKLIMPSDLDEKPRELIKDYLRDTPFEPIFYADPPFEIDETTRFEHHWIVAGTGHGKTQTLQYLIAHDLPQLAKGKQSVVVIDSQGDLIRNIARLDLWQDHPDRLVLIDPTDIEYPVALNLFSLGTERLHAYSPLEKEKLLNSAIELTEYILGALLGAEMTSKQSTLFRYCIRLTIAAEGTIHTFRDLMTEKTFQKHAHHLDKLPDTAREFFKTEFFGKEFAQTRSQVSRRIWAILENQTFERMFSHKRNKLDLFSEMNQGKCILINASKEMLKQNGTEIFGRFFIAMIAQAAQERATLPHEKRTPTFVYIDECQDYVDDNVSLILEQARKFKIGMVLSHQYIGQLAPKLQESFAANTTIKFAGGVSADDARRFARMMNCDPDFIQSQRKGHFAAYVRNYTDRAVSLHIPFGVMEDLDRLSSEAQDTLRKRMRAKYAVHVSELKRHYNEPPPPPEEEEDIRGAKTW